MFSILNYYELGISIYLFIYFILVGVMLDWETAQGLTYSTNYFSNWLWKAGTLKLRPNASNKMSTTTGTLQTTYPRHKWNWQTDQLNLTNNRPISNRQMETDLWLMTNFAQVFQPIQSWLNWPISFNEPDLQHNLLKNTIHLTMKMTSAQVVETSVTNNSSSQNYPHPDDHTNTN